MTILHCREIELKDVKKIIVFEANKCYRLLKKPPIHDVEDLIQEGTIVFLRTYKKYKPESKHTFKQFFYPSLINRFSDILDKSYKEINSGMEYTEISIWNCPSQLSIVKECCENLSEVAVEYIQVCTNPPKDLQWAITHSSKQRHGLIRKYLGISLRKEQRVRAEIIHALVVGD